MWLKSLAHLTCLLTSAVWAQPEKAANDLDLKGKHPIVIVKEDSSQVAAIPRRPGTVLVANFNHDKHTYFAELPIEHVPHAYLTDTTFAELHAFKFGHATFFFETEKDWPVRLYREDGTLAEELDGFAYSLNYAARPGVGYNPIKGLNPFRYKSTHSLRSPHDLALYVALHDRKLKHESSWLHEIDYTVQENGQLALGLIEFGDREGTSKSYQTVCYSCSNIPFRVINQIRPHNGTLAAACGYAFTGLAVVSPARAHIALQARGLKRRSIRFKEHPLFQSRRR